MHPFHTAQVQYLLDILSTGNTFILSKILNSCRAYSCSFWSLLL